MINIKDLTEEHKGQKVIYTTDGGTKDEGVITSWNDTWVFVRYGKDVGSKSTRPSDLEWFCRRASNKC